MMPTRKMYFLGLNAVRVLSIISLILVFASSILVMVTNIKAVNAFEANKINNITTDHDMTDCDYIEGSTVPNQAAGVFWAVVSSLLIIFQIVALLLSECSWPLAFFDRYFPVLGTQFGLGALGIFQGLIATQILSHHADDFTLVSAFFLFAIGCINMLLGLIFRAGAKEKRSVRGWRAEAKGVLPSAADLQRPSSSGSHAPAYGYDSGAMEKGYLNSASYDRDAQSLRSVDKASLGFGRQGEKAAGLRGFMLTKPEESLPRYVSPPTSTAHGGAVTRSNTTVSSSSSFSSGHQSYEGRQAQLHKAIREHGVAVPRRRQDDEDSDDLEYVTDDETTRRRAETPPPTFKSSRTAI